MTSTTAPAWSILEKRGLKEESGYWLSVCPSHKDDKRSLGIKIADDGKLLLHCFAGCTAQAICDSIQIKMQDLWPVSGEAKPIDRARVVAEYDYKDENGNVLYQVQRTDPKGFRQRRKVGDSWEWKLGDVRRVLYRLPDLLASTRPICVVEGEKDVENLVKAGFVATTWAGGAEGWRPEFAEPLRDRYVIVFPDNDDAGLGAAGAVLTYLPHALVVRLPGLKPKGDVSDWLEAGGKPRQLGELVRWEARKRMAKAHELFMALGGNEYDALSDISPYKPNSAPLK